MGEKTIDQMQAELQHLMAENVRLRKKIEVRKRMQKFSALVFSPDEIHALRSEAAEQTTLAQEVRVFERHLRAKLADAPPRILEEITSLLKGTKAPTKHTNRVFVSYTWDDRWY